MNGWAKGRGSTTVALSSLSASGTVNRCAEIAYRLHCEVFVRDGCM